MRKSYIDENGLSLRTIRLIRGYTQKEVAEGTGLDIKTIRAWETGSRKPHNLLKFITLVRFYKVSLDDVKI